MRFNGWRFSTPIQARTDSEDMRTWTSSTAGSILRSSSMYTTKRINGDKNTISTITKRVRIVSPIKWDCSSKYSLERKRNFINSTISYCAIKVILRSLDIDPRGGYKECVNKLLESEWIPDQRYIEYDHQLRAKPVQSGQDRVIHLESGDIDYLSTFSINDLKKWLKYNNIQQPVGQNKCQYVKLINKNYSFNSPSPDSFRYNMRPFRSNKTKTMSRTPRGCDKININSFNTFNTFNTYNNNDIDDDDDDVDVRMQLCFDD